MECMWIFIFFFQAEDGIRDRTVTGVQTCALPISLFKGKDNAFWDPKAEWQLSKVGLHYIGGLLKHARGMCAITNPLVNSYKRLVPGFEAPVNVAWSMRNRSPLIRVPERRGIGTRIELRMPD